jgi:hypothetical protein
MTQENVLEPLEVVKHLWAGDKVRKQLWHDRTWIQLTQSGDIVDETCEGYSVDLVDVFGCEWVLYVEPTACPAPWLKAGDKLSQYDAEYVVMYADDNVAFCKCSDFNWAPYWTITKTEWPHHSKHWKVEAG